MRVEEELFIISNLKSEIANALALNPLKYITSGVPFVCSRLIFSPLPTARLEIRQKNKLLIVDMRFARCCFGPRDLAPP